MKAWYNSRTVWGGIISALAGAAGVLGFVVDQEAQAQFVNLALAISSAVGGAVAIYGRFRACSVLKRRPR